MDVPDFVSVGQRYEAMVRAGKIERDPAQMHVAALLDEIVADIRDRRLSSKSSALGWLFARRRRHARALKRKGLYIHGSVGRGKTMLMDLFHAAVPAKRKRRVHFHDFMADVHRRVHAHREALKRGETKENDPIPPVARALHEEAWVLCFDEFTVTDIADAMILSRLFTQLFALGSILVATSNVEPDNLYRDGLNRQLFLPFVDLLREHVSIVSLDSRTDYRLEKLQRLPVYVHPLDERASGLIERSWADLLEGSQAAPKAIPHRGRTIEVPLAGNGAARFTFDALCRRPYGASDYRAIAERYHTVVVEGVPVMSDAVRNEAKRFILLVDTFYDMKRRLVISAQDGPDKLYPKGRGTEVFEFERTASRLIEMQSADYMRESEGVAAAEDKATA